MIVVSTPSANLTCRPVVPDAWPDLEALFGRNGAYGGCWCMWFRLKRSEFDRKHSAGTRRALKQIVNSGEVPGLLAYAGDQPVGWVSVAPREAFPVLDRSPVLKRLDDQPVWSVVCFFVAKTHRRQGVTDGLLQAAVDYAREHGARIVEGYLVDPKKGSVSDASGFHGLVSTFRQAGFAEVARRSATRPIMRYTIDSHAFPNVEAIQGTGIAASHLLIQDRQ